MPRLGPAVAAIAPIVARASSAALTPALAFALALACASSSVSAQSAGQAYAPAPVPATASDLVHDEPPPFAGELLILTSPRTFSSGNWFAVVAQDNGIGRVVGEPTGNAPSPYGDILSFTRPRSALGSALSHKQWRRPKPERDPAATLTPGVLVTRTRADVIAGRDPVLEWLRAKR